jgi:hypothetical protein
MTKTTMDPPLTLGLPLGPPSPVAGCEECARLAELRGEATGRGDFSRVSDINVMMRGRHGPPVGVGSGEHLPIPRTHATLGIDEPPAKAYRVPSGRV